MGQGFKKGGKFRPITPAQEKKNRISSINAQVPLLTDKNQRSFADRLKKKKLEDMTNDELKKTGLIVAGLERDDDKLLKHLQSRKGTSEERGLDQLSIDSIKQDKKDKELKEGLEKKIKEKGFDTSRINISVMK